VEHGHAGAGGHVVAARVARARDVDGSPVQCAGNRARGRGRGPLLVRQVRLLPPEVLPLPPEVLLPAPEVRGVAAAVRRRSSRPMCRSRCPSTARRGARRWPVRRRGRYRSSHSRRRARSS
jgi:hypothetical protein